MTPQTAQTNGSGTITKIACGVLVSIIATLVIATVIALGTVRVNAAGIESNCEAVRGLTLKASKNSAELSAVKGDLQEIKAILLRIERKVETE